MPRHHYVPQFLLRGFSDERNLLKMVSRTDARFSQLSAVRKAAAQNGFYAIPTEDVRPEARDDHNPETMEASLAKIEAAAASDVLAIRNRSFAFTLEAHYRLVRLVAMQISRVPGFRRDYIHLVNVTAKDSIASRLTPVSVRKHLKGMGSAADDASVRRFYDEVLQGNYSLVPSDTHLIQQSMWIALEIFMPELFQRIPRILRFSDPSLLTSDAAVGLWDPESERPRSIGVANARAIFVPLDRWTAIAFMQSGKPFDRVVEPLWAHHINLAVADAATEWIYHHPNDDPLAKIDLPQPRRLVKEVESVATLKDGSVRVRGKRYWA
ncbi:DUF4238 domain-containing protein [Arthrobacter sp. CAN_A1]|uniref:DUF4238 domain-containing protein n=1 Tax=Arthrobacter sp. CAN_A1 TaxID=2787717 RepID=UPI0018C9B197